MPKIGPILGVIGGLLMIVAGIMAIQYIAGLEAQMQALVATYGYTLEEL